ncbi:chloramphenicol acetyltransferase [Flavobacterium reichenbachii]|uniref:Chloramphenicol acetyltransferase n=1 Tax=Flavobacterium reichenbachii TaxID=362418 RepID=A0A085ZSY3_9FLAO|nr:chloramphenicol acetyltransferase [Flavobacterium reichenbachii]KFF07547.1 chloramphenicol acetyltransferase [Flavobacterium reichenbachii]OXB14188.1 chloramphenicol acetyltransferase [Flavobacterium reichenbachii]
MKTVLDLENWNRKEHFAHFKQMEEPFFGATVEIDCTKAYQTAKELKVSFFIYYLHKTLTAVNSIENFKYRISEDKIYINDRVDASATIGREDGTFGFSLIEYNTDFKVFEETTLKEIERIQNTTGLFTRSFDDDNVIHFSAIPWLNFTSLTHARSFTYPDSCPKISFGRMTTSETGKKTMPMAVYVHHGLMDGLHLGQFVDYFQELMNH